MNISNKVFFTIIISVISISIAFGLVVRGSIKEYKYNDIFDNSKSYSYYPYDSVEYSNGTYIDIDKIEDIDSSYKYIIKGKSLKQRRVLDGAVLTEIQVCDVLKGDISSDRIEIYEPMTVKGEFLSTFDGYNFIKDEKEYIFCLTDLKDGVKNISEDNIKIYNYATPFYGKFPIEYEESEFKVYIKDDKAPARMYNEFEGVEQVFSSENRKQLYFKEYNRLIKMFS